MGTGTPVAGAAGGGVGLEAEAIATTDLICGTIAFRGFTVDALGVGEGGGSMSA
jgi:hypothetical protein